MTLAITQNIFSHELIPDIQSHHRMFEVPRCPQHSEYLFWNVSQRLYLVIALALSLEQTCQQI
jgi:hypothetical protein